jgi:hypothetical protein
MLIAENIARITQRMAVAAHRADRKPEEIALMAVSKTFPADSIREAYGAGLRLFGESRVQEFSGKMESLQDLKDIAWHMIGHLQANKAAKAAELFGGVDSVDSVRLARRLNAGAEEANKKLPILIEINIGGEEAKSGLAPESAELDELFRASPELSHLQIRGLMTVPPFRDRAEETRPYFRRLRELRAHIASRNFPQVEMSVLSMGMSHDFEIAIEEGSTCVRVGTAIFGER